MDGRTARKKKTFCHAVSQSECSSGWSVNTDPEFVVDSVYEPKPLNNNGSEIRNDVSNDF